MIACYLNKIHAGDMLEYHLTLFIDYILASLMVKIMENQNVTLSVLIGIQICLQNSCTETIFFNSVELILCYLL